MTTYTITTPHKEVEKVDGQESPILCCNQATDAFYSSPVICQRLRLIAQCGNRRRALLF